MHPFVMPREEPQLYKAPRVEKLSEVFAMAVQLSGMRTCPLTG